MYNNKPNIAIETINEIIEWYSYLDRFYFKTDISFSTIVENEIKNKDLISVFKVISEKFNRNFDFKISDEINWKENEPIILEWNKNENFEYTITLFNFSLQVPDRTLLTFISFLIDLEMKEIVFKDDEEIFNDYELYEYNKVLLLFYLGLGSVILRRNTISYKFKDVLTGLYHTGFYQYPIELEFLIFLEALILNKLGYDRYIEKSDIKLSKSIVKSVNYYIKFLGSVLN
jgi:hypothetical protein